MTLSENRTTLACQKSTLRDLRGLKRGGISYDELLQRMIEQYEPRDTRR